MIKVKDGYAKLVGTTASGSASHILLSNGGVKAVSDFAKASALDNYLPLSGGRMNSNSYIRWNDGHEGNDFSDWNSVAGETGLKIISSVVSTSNAPGTYSTALHVKGRYGFQLASIGGDDSKFYIRNIRDINDWCQLIHSRNINSFAWTSSNDGSGSGLDADLLDGYHVTHFMSYIKGSGYVQANLLNSELWNVAGGNGYIEYYDNGTWFNSRWGRVLAHYGFDGDLRGNASSATKLQTARTIWGQSFDGSGDISGSIDNCNWIRYYKGGSVSGYIVGRGEEITGGDGLGLWTYGNTPIFLGTGSKQRMTIDSSGNVGIGTTSPSYKLDVNGAIRANGNVLLEAANGTTGGGIAFWDASGWVNGTINAKNLILNYAGGNVGIGTTSPAQKLHVNGSAYIGTTYEGICISRYGNTIDAISSNGSSLPLYLNHTSTGDIRMVIGGGNVGIGTTSPSYKLDVNGGARFGSLTPTDGLGVIPFAVANSSYANTGWCASFGTEKGGVLLGYQNSKGVAIIGASKTENICICPDGGNVGIGTPTPGYKLHVAGTTFSTGFVKSESSDSYVLLGGGGHKAVSDFAPVSHSHSYVSTGGMVNGAYAVIPTYNGETGWHRIATIDGGTGYGSWILYLCGDWSWASNTNAILHINTMHTTAKITQVSGIVGFVTDVRLVPISANNYYVDVYINYSGANTPGTVYCYFLGNGAITTRTTAEKITASVSTAASITLVTGTKTNDNSYAAHFYENSDIRYKTIINNLAIKANQLANLPLFDFKWQDNEDQLNTGTSAQAVQELLPYIVSGTDKLTLDYGVLGTIAGITACRELTEQEKEINELKEQIKFLKDEINNLKTNKLWQS